MSKKLNQIKIAIENGNVSNIPFFSFEGQQFIGYVTKVYDGDTIHFATVIDKKIQRLKCRLARIDTPEIKTSNTKEKEAAMAARDFLKSRIMAGTPVEIKCGAFDKYGRLLVEVLAASENINDAMVSGGYARLYDGGTKQAWNF